jgi:hypothetical protein
MAFIGNTNTTQGFIPAIDYFSGNGSSVAFTLSRPVASVYQFIVAIDNVIQNPSSAYTVSGNTITFTSAPLTGTNNIWVEYTSLITQVISPGQNTVFPSSLSTTNALYWDTSGYVGIGTTSPAVKLDVGYVAGAVALRIQRDASSRLDFYQGGGVSYIDSSPASAQLAFATVGTERMRIDSSGNVGIGQTTDSTARTVSNPSGTSQVAFMAGGTFAGSASYPSFGWAGQVPTNGGRGAGMFLPADGTIAFSTTATERMRIDSSGQVGIGTASPSRKLQVVGTSYLDPIVLTAGFNIFSSYSYNNGTANTIGDNFNNAHNNIIIVSTAGTTVIPVYANGGAGIAWTFTALDPDAGTWSYGTGLTINFVQAGTGGNTYSIVLASGSGQGTIQRTAGSLSYTVYIQRMVA